MDHVAIMKKSWGLIPKILSGEKTIESRWHQSKRTPWNRVTVGDRVYFKNSGGVIAAMADVSEVMQFAIDSLDDARRIILRYGQNICLANPNPAAWPSRPKYCVLIHLQNPKLLKPFSINKSGFGSATAWITVDSIDRIRL